jgi:FtsP/CotA-like multicopper oxidase with cupredoxin domain
LTLTRRRFVQGVAAVGIAAAVEGKFNPADAEVIDHSHSVLTGNHFDLTIEPHHVDFTGRRTKAIQINGSLPGPTLKWREGETVTIAVTKFVITGDIRSPWHKISTTQWHQGDQLAFMRLKGWRRG